MKRWYALWLMFVLLVVGTMTAEARTPYQKGYADGCRSAKKGVIIRKTRLFNNNSAYRNGWYAGKRACRIKKARKIRNAGVWTYNRGYNDGCRSAKGRWRKNARAYRNVAAYRNGWNAGWRACKRRKVANKIGAGWNSYARGYSDGCMSARGNWHKNIRAFNRFPAYRRGWRNGWRACRGTAGSGWNSYARGFRDGCSTARGVWRKNVTAYRRFAAYRNGWNAGRRACSKKNNPWNNYNIGYRDGCSSARGIWTKNVHAYRVFPAYRRGWNAGWAACKRTIVTKKRWNSYSRGYRDGCSTARGVWRKNIRAYRLYRAYRNGWLQGRRDCAYRGGAALGGAALGAADELLEDAVQSDAAANEISRMLFAAKEYVRQNYVKKPLPKAMELQVHSIGMDNGYGMVDVTPVFSDGSEIGTEYIPDVPFQFCMKKSAEGEWYVLYDLSHSGELSPEDLEQIRKEFPKEFPVALLPEYWKRVMTGSDGDLMEPKAGTGTTGTTEREAPETAPQPQESGTTMKTR